MLSIALHVLLAAQIQATVPKTVSSVDDIEIGMSVDLVIAGLTKQGYTLRDMFADTAAHDQTKTTWVVRYKDNAVGSFMIDKGRVIEAEMQVYDSQDSARGGGGPIGLAEALYWIFYDNGLPLESENREFKETTTVAQFTTRDIEMRTSGLSDRKVFVRMGNGANYRIDLYRLRPDWPVVFVSKVAPFIKKK